MKMKRSILENKKQAIEYSIAHAVSALTSFLVGEKTCSCYHNNSRKVKTLSGFGILR
jgi:hypothetical protein